jgi:hypothetical protein
MRNMRAPVVTSAEAQWSGRLKRLLAVAALTATGLIVWGLVGAERKALALEAGKVGMQLAVVTLIGLALTYVLGRFDEARKDQARQIEVEREKLARQIEVEREERRRLNDYRLTVFRDALVAYNTVKTTRRALRALGFALPTKDPLDPNRLAQFNAHMLTLNEAELSLERVEREIAAQPHVFPEASKRLDKLNSAERFLRQVLEVWETNALQAAEPDGRQRTSLVQLQDFLARRTQKRADDLPSLIDAFESAIRRDLISPLITAPTVPKPQT